MARVERETLNWVHELETGVTLKSLAKMLDEFPVPTVIVPRSRASPPVWNRTSEFAPAEAVTPGLLMRAAPSAFVVETKADGAARINRPGVTASAGANSLVRFQTGGLALDRGTITVGTGNSSSIFARDFKVTPVSSSWTQFNVSRSTRAIQILARKNDVMASCGTNKPVTVKAGQQLSRGDAPDCGLATEQGGAPTAANGPVLASPAAQKIALAVGGGLTAWAIFQGDTPVSPSVP